MQQFHYNFIAIEGNIGAGKTTLCKLLAEEYNCRLILEGFSDNPFLPKFYENPERHAFSVELFFMTERHKQLQENLVSRELFQPFIIADYFFLKTLIFAKNNLKDDEYRLFQRLFNVLNSTFPKPELLVYLHRSVPNLLSNIRQRGRTFEQDISAEYLETIQNAYLHYFKNEKQIPILIIDIEDANFVDENAQYEALKSLINRPYEKGIHRTYLKQQVKE